jgi:hypothetical protein
MTPTCTDPKPFTIWWLLAAALMAAVLRAMLRGLGLKVLLVGQG